MASSKLVFSKFERWKKLKTVLKLVVLTKDGIPEKLFVQVVAVDFDARLVSFGVRNKKAFRVVDFGDASFSIDGKVLAAERPTGDVLTCEELIR